MNIFGLFEKRVADALSDLAEAGTIPTGLDVTRVVVEPPRDSSHGDLVDQRRHGSGEGSAHESARPRRIDRRRSQRRPARRQGRDRRSWLHQPQAEASCAARGAAGRRRRHGRFRSQRAGRGRRGERRIRLRQPDRPDACGPWPRRGIRRCALRAAAFRRPQGEPANITSTTPARRSTSSPARPFCATARRWARISARSRKVSIRATT